MHRAVSTQVNAQLPDGWNASQDVCSLQYKHEATGQTCLVKAIPMAEQLLISAVVCGMGGDYGKPNSLVFSGGPSKRQSLHSDDHAIKIRSG